MRDQRGNADPATLGTASIGGFLVGVMGILSVNEWVAVGGFAVSLASLGVYVWRSRTMVSIARQQLREQQEHNEEILRIKRGHEE